MTTTCLHGRPRRPTVACCALLTVLAAATLHAADEWVERARVPGERGNLYFYGPWDPQSGAALRLSQTAGGRTADIDVRPAACTLTLTPPDALSPRALEFRSLTRLEALPAEARARALWTLKVREREWTLYLDRRPVYVFPQPFEGAFTLLQRGAPPNFEDAMRTRFQKVGRIVFDNNFFLPGDTEDPLVEWRKMSGTWQLRTAADVTADRGYRIRKRRGRAPDPERSANFSNLLGKGEKALILAGHDFYDDYSLAAAMVTASGEGGLVFCHTREGAYHALTLTMRENDSTALLRLWRRPAGTADTREVLAAAVMDLTHDQWVKLEIKLSPRRIQGLLDETEIFNVAAELPPGGQFGLYADAADGFLFDDTRVRSHDDLHLGRLRDLQRHTVVEKGEFFPRAGLFRRAPDPDGPARLDISRSRQDQWLALGHAQHKRMVFAARFRNPRPSSGKIGLILAYRDASTPHWRFSRWIEGTEECFALQKIGPDGAVLATPEHLRLPIAPNAFPAELELECDASQGRTWRLYRNGKLVLTHRFPAPVPGAAGLFVGAGTQVAADRLRYTAQRAGVYSEQLQRNPLFMDDPYMRHWASPEGEWAQDAQKRTWLKGDVHGRFTVRMPYVENSTLHFSVSEKNDQGRLALAIGAESLQLLGPRDAQTRQRPVLAAGPVGVLATLDPEKDKTDLPYYDIHYEDHWLWALSGDTLLFKIPLVEPLAGRRLRIEGFTPGQLRHGHVQRFSVKDYLFNESPHQWMHNGGEWAVINRFDCDPRWSHMNGESREGLAALWSKHDFGGDFCLEMYAGMRHGFYERAGDLNFTALSPLRTPGRGYSVVCTGWDRNHSQLYTRLFANGTETERSEKYLVPRHREGKKRKILDPLIRQGRDLHGAWYYAKLRRVGPKLEYWFDNELVFSHTESEPVPDGAFGIWTFMNSMMVARVKMAAERIAPRPVRWRTVANDATLDILAPPVEVANEAALRSLHIDGLPAERVLPAYWKADDPTGHTRLRWPVSPRTAPFFVAETTLGAGEMFTRAALPPVRYPQLAGWRFRVKRTANARFNFHYSMGRFDKDGAYKPEATFFHRLTGEDFTEGAFLKTGATELPSTTAPAARWYEHEPWTEVRVWLPPAALTGLANMERVYVRAEGFGNLQPGDIMQGLTGNAPGEAYAVQSFGAVRLQAPVFAGAAATSGISVTDARTGAALGHNLTQSELATLAAQTNRTGLSHWRMAIPRSQGEPAAAEVAWIVQPEEPEASIVWHPEIANAVRIQTPPTSPDRRLHGAAVRMNGQAAQTWREGPGTQAAFVPLQAELTRHHTNVVHVHVAQGSHMIERHLAWADAPLAGIPVLLSLQGSAVHDNFETRQIPAYLRKQQAQMRLVHRDSRQGAFLRIANDGKTGGLRWASGFPGPDKHGGSLARHPLLQFRYRAEPMTRVSLLLDEKTSAIRLSENLPSARSVRGTPDLIGDGQWRTWTGRIDDAIGQRPLSENPMRTATFRFGSRHPIDQTGLFSVWDIDDLTWGPAVSARRPLTLTPHYFDFQEISAVHLAICSGMEPVESLEPAALAALTWKEIPNRRETVVDTSALKAGPHRLLLRARNAAGGESALTDIPFLYGPRPPLVSHALSPSVKPEHNHSALTLTFDTDGGAPVDIESLRFEMNGRPLPLDDMGSSYEHGPEQSTLTLNWPYLIRDRIGAIPDQGRFTLAVRSITDGAGQVAEDVLIPMTVDFASDKTPPTVLPTLYPDNVLWSSGWESPSVTASRFRARGALQLHRDRDAEPYLEHTAHGRGNMFWTESLRAGKPPWSPVRHPYLAFAIRRPVIADEDRTSMYLMLTFKNPNDSKDKVLHIPLAGALPKSTPGHRVANPAPIRWTADQWHPVLLDVKALMAAAVPRIDPDEQEITKIQFVVNPDPNKPTLTHVRSFFVFSAWRPQDRVQVQAFDASGIGGVLWRTEENAPTMSFAPVPGPAADVNRWGTVQVTDRAGNRSYAWHVPLGPGRSITP